MHIDIRLKRLYFRSAHRGSKETDLILGHFAKAHLASLDEDALNVYEAFLEESDNDIWDWVVGKSEPTNPAYCELIEKLRARYD